MQLIKCPKCGESDLFIDNSNLYACKVCNSKFKSDDYEKYQELFNKAVSDNKIVEIGNVRHIIDSELKKPHLNKEEIRSLSNEILKVYPDDVIARFLLEFIKKNVTPRSYEAYIKSLYDIELQPYELAKITPLIVKSMEFKDKELVEEFLNNKNIYNEYEQAVKDALILREKELERFTPYKDVFICHAHNDIDLIRNIISDFDDNTISTWISEDNMPWDTENYWDIIEEAISFTKVFLFVLSSASAHSKDCMNELKLAIKHNKTIRVEYRIDDSENNIPLKEFFDGIQWIDKDRDLLVNRVYSKLNAKEEKKQENKSSSSTKEEEKKGTFKESIDNLVGGIKNFTKQFGANPDDEKEDEKPKPKSKPSVTVKINDKLTMGTFDNTDILWRVLDVRGNRALVITDRVIESKAISDKLSNYEASSIRRWLNEVFYKNSFTFSEKERIIRTTVDNSLESANTKKKKLICVNTEDFLFLLSYKEIINYFVNAKDRIAYSLAFENSRDFKTRVVKKLTLWDRYLDKHGRKAWWLRSPYKKKKTYIVGKNGVVSYEKSKAGYIGIRPAMWIMIK